MCKCGNLITYSCITRHVYESNPTVLTFAFRTVVTFFPGRENDEHTGYSREGDVRSLIYQDINGDYANQCNDPFDFAALAIRHAIKGISNSSCFAPPNAAYR